MKQQKDEVEQVNSKKSDLKFSKKDEKVCKKGVEKKQNVFSAAIKLGEDKKKEEEEDRRRRREKK